MPKRKPTRRPRLKAAPVCVGCRRSDAKVVVYCRACGGMLHRTCEVEHRRTCKGATVAEVMDGDE